MEDGAPPLRPKHNLLSLFFFISIKDIFRLGRAYIFPRPPNCARCKSNRLWGHGYVEAYFDGYDSPISLRRYRCDDCGCVYTIRPFGYFPRHHAEIRIILYRICHRITKGVWDKSKGLSRQRQGHWLRALIKNIRTYLGFDLKGDVVDGFYDLVHKYIVPVIRSV